MIASNPPAELRVRCQIDRQVPIPIRRQSKRPRPSENPSRHTLPQMSQQNRELKRGGWRNWQAHGRAPHTRVRPALLEHTLLCHRTGMDHVRRLRLPPSHTDHSHEVHREALLLFRITSTKILRRRRHRPIGIHMYHKRPTMTYKADITRPGQLRLFPPLQEELVVLLLLYGMPWKMSCPHYKIWVAAEILRHPNPQWIPGHLKLSIRTLPAQIAEDL
jgi:hypothetical protein